MKDNTTISEYIKTFIRNFVFNNKQERARMKLLPIEKNKEWDEANLKLVTWLDFKKVVKIEGKDKSESALQAKYGNKAGIYLDFSSEPRSMPLSEAAGIHFRAALFVLQEGNLVFFFTHDDDIYVCQKK